MLKAEAIRQAYGQIRISGLTVVPTPEDEKAAILELDQQMFEWAGIRRYVNYNFPEPTSGNELVESDPGDELGVFDWALAGVISSLAVRLVEYFGKPIPESLARKKRVGLRAIKQNTVDFPEIPYPNRMPRGSGNTFRVPYTSRFYVTRYTGRDAERTIQVEQILDCEQDFSNFLEEGDTISTYTIEADPHGGIRVISDSKDGNVINFRVEAIEDRNGYVDVAIVTTNGLTIEARKCFDTITTPCPRTSKYP